MPADQSEKGLPPSSEARVDQGGSGTDQPMTPAAAIEGDLYCPECEYNLRTLTSNRCPECGYDIQIVRQRQTQIPWVYRDDTGAFRAYWKTVWMLTFQHKRFCLEISRPVDLAHARWFRWLTVLHAYLAVMLVTLAVAVADPAVLTTENCVSTGVVHIGILACILALTAIPHYALRHRDVPLEQQHRAAVLMLYTSAPLAWMFVAALLAIAGLACAAARLGDWDAIFYMSTVGAMIILLVITLGDVLHIVKAMLREPGPVFWMSVKLVVLWFVAGFLTLVGIPFVATFLAVVFYSLQ